MPRLEVLQSRDQTAQVLGFEGHANVEIKGRSRRTVQRGRYASNDHEVDTCVNQPLQ